MFNKESFMNEFMSSVKLTEKECSALVEEWRRTKDKDTLDKLIKGLYLKIVSIISVIPEGSRFEDITEDIFQDIVLLLIECASDIVTCSKYFVQIFERKAIRMVKRKYVYDKSDCISIDDYNMSNSLHSSVTSEVSLVERDIDLEFIRAEVNLLTPREQMVINMFFGFEGTRESCTAIARKMGISVGRVYKLLHESLDQLNRRINLWSKEEIKEYIV